MIVAAFVLLLLGLIGLVVPFVPGLPLLVLSALLFAAKSPGLRRRLRGSPPLGWFFERLDRLFARGADGLNVFERLWLKTLSAASRMLPRR